MAKKSASSGDLLVHVVPFLALSGSGRDHSAVGSNLPPGQSFDVETLEVEECLPPPSGVATASVPEPTHSQYRGFDIGDAAANGGRLQYDIESDEQVVFCDTYTRGAYDVFVIDGSHNLVHMRPGKRFRMSKLGRATFIRSSCLTKLRQCCHGAIVAFLPKGEEHWRLAVVSAIWYCRNEGDENKLDLWVWNGPVNSDGVPELLLCEDWSAMKEHLTLTSFIQDEVTIFFVNQVNTALVYCSIDLLKRMPRSDMQAIHAFHSRFEAPFPWVGVFPCLREMRSMVAFSALGGGLTIGQSPSPSLRRIRIKHFVSTL